ncbi:penicillin-binding protein 1A [Viridibacterium curvum]|uniref:Penicillin-binding protein 1A n=1 Tax=Viridibacterium curvum TaxID=1101404 RepID=A0ABP9QI13_9RHOO
MRKSILFGAAILVGVLLLVCSTVGIAVAFAWPKLPELSALTDYKPRIPLRIYTADGELIGEYGEERRSYAPIKTVPDSLKHAILAAEDDRFYEHGGVDFAGLTRATLLNLLGGARRQGGSTITMQVARNFYLSREKTITRKLYEILLSIKIEKNLTKDQILEVYLNQIYLGQRAYGFAAAAQIYYGKELSNLTVGECAMLAGLPKAPSTYNPVVNPPRAKQRQQYVLRRMTELGYIDEAAHDKAVAEPVKLAISKSHPSVQPLISLHAEYVAEMARQMAYEQFKEDAYTRGIKVITTVMKNDQQAAYRSLRRGLLDYERRHGYRGAEAQFDLAGVKNEQDEQLEELLEDVLDQDEIRAALVLEASAKKVRVYLRGGEVEDVTGDSLKYAAAMLASNAPQQKQVRRGALIRVVKTAKGWAITQPPEVEAAFVSLDPSNGAIRALVGGFDFNRNKFNHVTQAWRQPGSSFKPFIFSAALEKGYTPGSIFEDGPLSFTAAETGSQAWSPGNYDGKYEGPMSLRTALAKSKNSVAIRLLQAIGPAYGQDYVTSRFGFDADKNPPYLTLALGSGAVTPWQMASAYAIFANGGYRIQPYIVSEIRDENNRVVARVTPPVAGQQAEKVLDSRNVYLMHTMMQDVVRRGTAGKAMSLGRSDLAGKTGTTNDYVDAWFSGYNPGLVGVAWVGHDQPKKLGSGETGGVLALPIWIGYMEQALKGVPDTPMPVPGGLLRVKTDKGEDDLIYEENMPSEPTPASEPAKE